MAYKIREITGEIKQIKRLNASALEEILEFVNSVENINDEGVTYLTDFAKQILRKTEPSGAKAKETKKTPEKEKTTEISEPEAQEADDEDKEQILKEVSSLIRTTSRSHPEEAKEIYIKYNLGRPDKENIPMRDLKVARSVYQELNRS